MPDSTTDQANRPRIEPVIRIPVPMGRKPCSPAAGQVEARVRATMAVAPRGNSIPRRP